MIILICGPPGVGKTAVATLLQEHLRRRDISFEMLDSDQFNSDPYRQLFERVSDSDGNWIIAGTFYKRKWQVRFERLEDVVIVYLQAGLETCLERNRNRETPIEEKAVHIIWQEFDEPDADVTIDVADRSPAVVVDLLVETLDIPDPDEP